MKIGDYVEFGNYPQNNSDTKEPIEWLVLDVSGNEALIISRYGLDCKQYHSEYVDMTWENCDLRKWLNNDFLEVAFSDDERKKIKVSNLKNDDNSEFETSGGKSTKDLVFCLSMAETEKYLRCHKDRKCEPTAYSLEQGVSVDFDDKSHCYWWLRSPGCKQDYAAIVDGQDSLEFGSSSVSYDGCAVRPALWIVLNK